MQHGLQNYQRGVNAALGYQAPRVGLLNRGLQAVAYAGAAFGTYREIKRGMEPATPKRMRGEDFAKYVPGRPSKKANVMRLRLVYGGRKLIFPARRRRVLMYKKRRSSRPMFRRPLRRRRRVYRRRNYRRRATWSRPDVFREVYKTKLVPTTLDTTTTTQVAALENHCAYSTFFWNLSYFSDALGSHKFFDSQIISTQTAGTNVTAAANQRMFDYERNNRGYKFIIKQPHATFRITPDWQLQGTPDNTSATPVFADITGMKCEAYVLTTRSKLRANLVTTGDTSGMFGVDRQISPLENSTSISGLGSGWYSLWATGIENRVGNQTRWTSATTLSAYNTSPTVAKATGQFLCQDGVSMYHSPELLKKFTIRRASSIFIPAGQNGTMRIPMRSFVVDTSKLDVNLPVATTSWTSWATSTTSGGYVPRGYPVVVLRFQIFSNKSNSTVFPPVAFGGEVITKAKMIVRDSDLGGNLYYNLTPQGSLGGAFLQPANPQRAGGTIP